MPQVEPRPTTPRSVKLGGGVVVPYPEPLNEAASKIGRANSRTNTRPEQRIRSAVHRRGLRFRKELLLRVGGVRVRPDLVFTRWRVAAFVNGCFWHGCPDHRTVPRRNADYWGPKLRSNIDRDRRVEAGLVEAGWVVVRIWEHEDVEEAAERLVGVVVAIRKSRGA